MDPTFEFYLSLQLYFEPLSSIHANKKCELIDFKPRDNNW